MEKQVIILISVILVVAIALHESQSYTGAFSLRYFFFGKPDSFFMEGGTTGTGTDPVPPKNPPPQQNTCQYHAQANALGDHCYGSCANTGEYCAPKEGTTNECKCRKNNPAVTIQGHPTATENKKCTYCMAYAEAGGANIPDDCMMAVACVIHNRVNDKKYKPRVSNACEAVARGEGKQFNPYLCVGDATYSNQKYCNCASDTISNKQELLEARAAKNIVEHLDCSAFPATYFNNVGSTPRWMKKALEEKRCWKVPAPGACQSTFEFFACA